MTDTTNAITHATDETFHQEVLESDRPVLVDFWAPWCGPCKAIAPLLEQIAADRADVRVVKVNIDDNQSMATQYNIRAIPALLLFRDGEVKKQQIGAVGKAELESMLNDA